MSVHNEVTDILSDLKSFVPNCLTIVDKHHRVVPFLPWPNQNDYFTRVTRSGYSKRRVHLKPRQVGESSGIVANFFHKATTIPNTVVSVITQDLETRQKFRLAYKHHLDDLEAMNLKPTVGLDNDETLEFPVLNSRILFRTAEARGEGRAWTANYVHATEVAHWEHPAETLGGVLQSVPTDGEVDVESTPRGAGGVFHNIVKAAMADVESPLGGHWELFFYPWWETEEYKSEDESILSDLTDHEIRLITEHGLNHGHIRWRRAKVKELSVLGIPFEQEYPEDPITCFFGGARSPFHLDTLQRLQTDIRPPMTKGIVVEGSKKYSSALWIWKEPRGDRQYIIPGDIGEGAGLDFTAFPVIDARSNEVVACYYDNHTDPVMAAKVMVDIGYHYNTALLAPETYPGVGYATGKYLENEYNYPNLYYGIDPRRPEYVGDVGWRTDARTRPMMQTALLEHIPTGSLIVYDGRIIQELSSLVWDDSKSRIRLQAIEGENDDACMALGIGMSVLELMPITAAANNVAGGSIRPRVQGA